jgi:uncharacterized radical SAM superfamily protein
LGSGIAWRIDNLILEGPQPYLGEKFKAEFQPNSNMALKKVEFLSQASSMKPLSIGTSRGTNS